MDKKWNLQDIKPARSGPPQKTHRDVVPERREMHKQSYRPTPAATTPEYETEEDDTENVVITKSARSRRKGIFLTLILLFVVVGGIVATSYFMRGAEIFVQPRTNKPNINAEFTAYLNPTQPNQLGYEILTLEEKGERQVRATGKQPVQEQATGIITIYKSTPGVQRLITNTRFEDTNGQIYRLVDSIVVPGSVDGVAGNIQAEVFASEPGDEYNVPAGTRFTIPGLESDPNLFNAMYAENNEDFTGGFDDLQYIIDEDELAAAKQVLQVELRDALLQKLPNEKPAGFVAFPEAVTITYSSLPAVDYGDDLVTIIEQATLRIPLFAEAELASYLAAAAVPGYENNPVRIEDPTKIQFSYTSATTTNSNITTVPSLDFELEGRPLIVWTYDAGRLATDILGANRTALEQVLSGYPAIERARAEVRPFWQRTFPTNIDLISITEELPDE